MSFTEEELAYLQSQPLVRIATVSADGQPDVVTASFELDDGNFSGLPGGGRARAVFDPSGVYGADAVEFLRSVAVVEQGYGLGVSTAARPTAGSEAMRAMP
ncbi:pyridoxamine 5'-phosphate oxidase family protein [Nonomuraea longispora]|uniref:pyridoxamine 5'-phosphate oxidase family protein n=1 Tax=Nonomuraea longispora TaxID=1848320 RepID=UPI001C704DFB|nr:pyridoxamine 5'-phosphate oxidase family protein [Nonomuraea longispora]